MPGRKTPYIHLSGRETQIMQALYAHGEATVREVRDAIKDSPSYNSVRVILGILEDKGFITHRREGRRYVYRPKGHIERAKRSAMRHLLETFFRGSTPLAVSAFIDMAASELTSEELNQLAKQIRSARKEDRR
ncbi:MAG: BlaI/MecI/CopY family transcriptional regulator [Phycisphaerales bacterium]|nr:MAG: BlaI/MecI/CopY family transcriptional regulator [Phycisphaerales bacterium]